MTDRPTVTTIATGVARVSWPRSLQEQGFTEAVAQISEVVGQALAEHGRVEALVARTTRGQRIATWSGLLREGVMRGGHVEDGAHADRIVYARVVGRPARQRPDGLPQPAQLVPPPQARHQPDADPRHPTTAS